MPPGIPYIIGNEAAERFSFYGMRSILIVFMTQYLVTRAGLSDHMSDAEARGDVAYFGSAVYFTPILGAILAEGFFGKYQDHPDALHRLLLRPFRPGPGRYAFGSAARAWA